MVLERKQILLGFLCVGVLLPLCVMWIMAVRDARLRATERREKYRNYSEMAGKVRIGMSRSQLYEVLGLPDNVDTEHMCIWLPRKGQRESDRCPLMELLGESGMILALVRGRVASKLMKCTETDPWELYSEVTGCSDEQSRSILGVAPKGE